MNQEARIRQTLADYAAAHDGEDVAAVVALFTEDGVISVPAGARPVGRAAIAAFLEQGIARRRATNKQARHAYSDEVIEIDGDRATVTMRWVGSVRIGDGPWEVGSSGQCVDQLVAQDGQWLFQEHNVMATPAPA